MVCKVRIIYHSLQIYLLNYANLCYIRRIMKAKEKEIQRTLLGIAVELPVNYTSTSLVENISGKQLLEKDQNILKKMAPK